MTLGPFLAYHDLGLSMRPDLYWPLDRLYKASDLGAARKDGVAGGGISIGQFADSPGGISGPPGAELATDFDGVNDRITSTYNPFVNGTVRTFAGWALRDASAAANHTLVASDGGGYPNIFIARLNNLNFDLFNAATPVTWANAWPAVGAWAHFAAIVDDPADTATLYINGALVSAQAFTDPYNAAVGNLEIGAYGSGTDFFDGRRSHFMVFPRALSAGEVASLYKAGAPAS